jgi:hypothetical protein
MLKRLLAVLVVLALVAPVAVVPVGAELNSRGRRTFDTMFDSSGRVGWPGYAADPFTCDSTHLPSTTKPAVHYWNTAALEARVCDGTAWRTLAAIGSAGSAESITTGDILDGTIANADISASAAIARSKLAEDALQAYGIPISSLMQTTGIALSASETAGNFDVTVATNVIKANGEVTDNETEVSVVQFQFVLPPEYVAAGDVSIRLRSALVKTGSPTDNGSTIDVAVYEQADAAVGSDLSTTTAAGTYAALDTYETDTFVITATGLVAGDILNVVITASVIDSEAGAGTIVLNMDPPKVLLDVKG